MKVTSKKLLIGTSVVAAMSVMAALPVSAVTVTTSGDVTRFCSDGINTFSGVNCTDFDETILLGNSSAPGGNIELNNGTDGLTRSEFQSAGVSTLTKTFDDGETITFSSLTGADWFGADGTTSFGENDFANIWFNELVSEYDDQITAGVALVESSLGRQIETLIGVASEKEALFNIFFNGVNVAGGVTIPQLASLSFVGGAQRLSDPNIAYANQDGNDIVFGLAGHQSASVFFNPNNPLEAALIDILEKVAFSEVVKVNRNGNDLGNFYSFKTPTDSGQVAADDNVSHNGNFEFKITGENLVSEKTPEPSSILGLIAIGGLFALLKRKS